jgi:hypothetical protein
MLLLTLMIIDPVEAAETVLHFWYSALVRPIDFLRVQLLRPIIEGVCNKITDQAAGPLQAKTFTFDSCSVRVVLKKEGWTALLAFLNVPVGLTTQRAHKIRIAVTMAPHRLDLRPRDLMLQQPEHLLARRGSAKMKSYCRSVTAERNLPFRIRMLCRQIILSTRLC